MQCILNIFYSLLHRVVCVLSRPSTATLRKNSSGNNMRQFIASGSLKNSKMSLATSIFSLTKFYLANILKMQFIAAHTSWQLYVASKGASSRLKECVSLISIPQAGGPQQWKLNKSRCFPCPNQDNNCCLCVFLKEHFSMCTEAKSERDL